MLRNLSPEQQWVRLKSNPISRGNGYVRHGVLRWEFNVRPSPLSRIYRILIIFNKHHPPNAIVLSPDLNKLAEGRNLPHVYALNPVRPCLYLPHGKEWTFDKSIAETIVPWLYLWLIYFEHWLATDDWQGGGEHPRKTTNDKM